MCVYRAQNMEDGCPTLKSTKSVFHLLGRLGWSPVFLTHTKIRSQLYLVIFDGKLQNFPRGSSRAMKGLNLNKAMQRPATEASIRWKDWRKIEGKGERDGHNDDSTFSNSATTRVAKQFWLFSAHLGYANTEIDDKSTGYLRIYSNLPNLRLQQQLRSLLVANVASIPIIQKISPLDSTQWFMVIHGDSSKPRLVHWATASLVDALIV